MYCWIIEMADIRMLKDNVLLDDRDGHILLDDKYCWMIEMVM